MNKYNSQTVYYSARQTYQTRRESNIKVDRRKMYSLILEQLRRGPATAREIAGALFEEGHVIYPDRQSVQPRLTELTDQGKVEVCCKKYDGVTHRNVSVYKMVVNE